MITNITSKNTTEIISYKNKRDFDFADLKWNKKDWESLFKGRRVGDQIAITVVVHDPDDKLDIGEKMAGGF